MPDTTDNFDPDSFLAEDFNPDSFLDDTESDIAEEEDILSSLGEGGAADMGNLGATPVGDAESPGIEQRIVGVSDALNERPEAVIDGLSMAAHNIPIISPLVQEGVAQLGGALSDQTPEDINMELEGIKKERMERSPTAGMLGSIGGAIGGSMLMPGGMAAGVRGIASGTGVAAADQLVKTGEVDPENLALGVGVGGGAMMAGKVLGKAADKSSTVSEYLRGKAKRTIPNVVESDMKDIAKFQEAEAGRKLVDEGVLPDSPGMPSIEKGSTELGAERMLDEKLLAPTSPADRLTNIIREKLGPAKVLNEVNNALPDVNAKSEVTKLMDHFKTRRGEAGAPEFRKIKGMITHIKESSSTTDDVLNSLSMNAKPVLERYRDMAPLHLADRLRLEAQKFNKPIVTKTATLNELTEKMQLIRDPTRKQELLIRQARLSSKIDDLKQSQANLNNDAGILEEGSTLPGTFIKSQKSVLQDEANTIANEAEKKAATKLGRYFNEAEDAQVQQHLPDRHADFVDAKGKYGPLAELQENVGKTTAKFSKGTSGEFFSWYKQKMQHIPGIAAATLNNMSKAFGKADTPYMKALVEAGERSPAAAMAAFHTFMNKDPKFREKMNKAQTKDADKVKPGKAVYSTEK